MGFGWKMSLSKWHPFWMAACLICCFIVILFYIQWKRLLMRNRTYNLSHNLTLEVKIVRMLSNYFQNAVLGRLEMLQCKCFFWQHQTFAGKFVKWERFLAVLREHIFFNVEWIDFGKMTEVFWVKLYCKISELFR